MATEKILYISNTPKDYFYNKFLNTTELIKEEFNFLKLQELYINDCDNNTLYSIDYLTNFYFRIQDKNFILRKQYNNNILTFVEQSRNLNLNKIDKICNRNMYIKDNSSPKPYKLKFSDLCDMYMPIFIQEATLNKPLFYKNENNNFYLNRCGGFLRDMNIKYESYNEDIKQGVEFIWNHIFNIWCSKKKDQFDIVKQWIINTVSLLKTNIAVYIKSEQGIGKSIIGNFIAYNVMNENIAFSTSSLNSLKNFNTQLVGKALMVLEEFPASSKNEWSALSSRLKDIITGRSITIEPKGLDSYDIQNNINIMIFSNNDAIKIEQSDRRYLMLDCDNKIIHNKNKEHYFNKLASYTNNKTVADAFFYYCVEHKNENYNFEAETRKIILDNKNLIKQDFLTNEIKFFNDLINNNTEIKDTKLKELYNDYKNYCLQSLKQKYKIYKDFTKYITETFNIEILKNSHAVNIVKTDINTIKDLFFERNYLNKDEYIEDQNINKTDEEIKETEDNNKLKEDYKKQNEDYKNLQEEYILIKKQNEELLKLKDDYKNLQEEITKIKNINESLNFDKNNLITKNKDLEEEIINLTFENNALEKENKIKENKIIELDKEIKLFTDSDEEEVKDDKENKHIIKMPNKQKDNLNNILDNLIAEM